MNEDNNKTKKILTTDRTAIAQLGGGPAKERGRRPSKLTIDVKAARAASSSTPGTTPTGSGQSTPGTPGSNITMLDLTWDDNAKKSVTSTEKRREEEEEEEKCTTRRKGKRSSRKLIVEKIVRLLTELDAETRHISTVARENTNTKKEIKEGIQRIRSHMSQLMTREALETITAEIPDVNTICTQKDPEKPPSNEKCTTNAYTQTEGDGTNLEHELQRATTHQQFLELANKHWPEEAYRHVKIWEGEDHDLDWEYDMAVNVTEDIEASRTVPHGLSRFYINASEARKQGAHKGELAMLRYHLETPAPQGGYNDQVRYVYLMINKDHKEDLPENQALRATLQALREAAGHHERGKIALFLDLKNDPAEVWSSVEDTRKLAEWVFRDSKAEITLMIPKAVRLARPQSPPQPDQEWRDAGKRRRGKGNKYAAEKPKPPPSKSNQPKRKGGETLLVKAGEGKTYADMVTTIRRIDMDALGIELSALKKTRTGDMLMVVKGGRGAATPLKEQIQCRMTEAKVTIRTDDQTILICDLDVVATREEVLEAIERVVDDETLRNQITVKELRPAFGGNQTAVVSASAEGAKKLLAVKSVRIGWSRCRIKEQMTIQRCYKCWRPGHTRSGCKEEEDRGKACLNCAKEGHTVKECREKAYCPLCRTEGHRADSARCPETARAMEAERRRRSRETGRTVKATRSDAGATSKRQ